MNVAAKLSTYGLALVVVFAGAWAAGGAVGPPGAGTGDRHPSDPGQSDHRDSGPTTGVPTTISRK
ncbi:hypothetical protein [Actinokineospora sp.]|uniref:hypothetical protein n=1 Tax=Actinokineospora sp. TaxID=1872133 RepID=UPI003D6A094E